MVAKTIEVKDVSSSMFIRCCPPRTQFPFHLPMTTFFIAVWQSLCLVVMAFEKLNFWICQNASFFSYGIFSLFATTPPIVLKPQPSSALSPLHVAEQICFGKLFHCPCCEIVLELEGRLRSFIIVTPSCLGI
jgi:hypothetical protein